MPYFLQSQIPELSGFNRAQQRFLRRTATELMYRDDPWFGIMLCYLHLAPAALSIYPALEFGGLFDGAMMLIVGGSIAATICICSGLLYSHLLASHMRPFLRAAIERHGVELEEIG